VISRRSRKRTASPQTRVSKPSNQVHHSSSGSTNEPGRKERPGQIVTRQELKTRLWAADTHVAFDAGLNTVIRKLRAALGDSADNPRFIETVPKRGAVEKKLLIDIRIVLLNSS